VRYEPGTLKVVAFDDNGKAVKETSITTAGKPHQIILEADRTQLKSNQNDLAFITVSVIDKNGNLCPKATDQLHFKVKGAGTFKAVCNGDPTSLELFHKPTMKLFSGKLVVIVEADKNEGTIELQVKGKGLKGAKLELTSND